MNRILYLFISCFTFTLTLSQSFINGDFEMTTSTQCDYNLADSVFNKKMLNVHAFGKKFTFSNKHYGEMDILTNGCFVEPQNGNWCVGLGVDTTTDAIAIELTDKLTIGQSYKLSFYLYGNTSFGNGIAPIEIGESENDSTFGIKIDSLNPISMEWRKCILNFKANQNSKFITVKNILGIKAWNQVDNFHIEQITSSDNPTYQVNSISYYPNPTNNILHVRYGSNNITCIQVVDHIGKIVIQKKLSGMDESIINIQYLKAGIYYLRVVDNNNLILFSSALEKI